jgi:hypothetical protein
VAFTVTLTPEGDVVGQPEKTRTNAVRVGERTFAISAAGLRLLRDDPEQRRQFVAAALSFRAFLRHWKFLDQETGVVRVLGDVLWPAQDAYIEATENPYLTMLKARQLGETTVAIAYDAWVARFRDTNARVHVFSSGDDAAKEVLENIKFGLEHLPPTMRLPMYDTARSIRLDLGAGGRAFIRSYPSTRAASRGATCNHLHLDEWSAQVDPRKVMQSVGPTVAPGGSFHILTTEVVGPESDTAAYFRKCIAGDGQHHAIFVPALARPDRDENWLEGKRREMPKADFAREYPSTWQEALEAAGDRTFSSDDIDVCSAPGENFGIHETRAEYEHTFAHIFGAPAKPSRKISVGVDLGLKQDATVIVVLDVTSEIVNVVGFERMLQPSVGDVQVAIEDTFARWPRCHINIEDSGIGYPIRQGVNVPEDYCHGLNTTGMSKPRMIGGVQFLIERHLLRFDAEAIPQLDTELRGYTTPDTFITTDCVMALAFAIYGAEHALQDSAGRILGVWKV